jgi:hypothetical protein
LRTSRLGGASRGRGGTTVSRTLVMALGATISLIPIGVAVWHADPAAACTASSADEAAARSVDLRQTPNPKVSSSPA